MIKKLFSRKRKPADSGNYVSPPPPEAMRQIEPATPPPRRDFWLVQITGHCGPHVREHVWALNAKEAITCVLESLPDTHPLFGSPGWSGCQAFPASRPFRINAVES